MRATEIFLDVVQLPLVVFKRSPRLGLPRRAVHRGGEPALLVDAPVARHLEVLRGVARLRLGFIQGVQHAHAFEWFLLDAIHDARLGHTDYLQHRRRNIDHVHPLRTQAALLRDALRPMDHHRLADAAVRGHLVPPPKRRRAGKSPAIVVQNMGFGAADLVEVLQRNVQGLGQPVEHRQLIECAVEAALENRTVVAGNVEDQRIVHFA